MQLMTAGHPDDPVLDMALSDALLRGVARGDIPELARVYRPGPTVAFGRLDALHSGYAEARRAASALGWTPVLRLGGGRAAAYDEHAVVIDVVTRPASIAEGTTERFASGTALVRDSLTCLGVFTELGELPREYCPGRWSVHLLDGPKVAGAAQRSIRGASLFTAVVVVGGGSRLREVLVAVYEALDFAWDPATAGAIADAHPTMSAEAVANAVVTEVHRLSATEEVSIPSSALDEAQHLLALHR